MKNKIFIFLVLSCVNFVFAEQIFITGEPKFTINQLEINDIEDFDSKELSVGDAICVTSTDAENFVQIEFEVGLPRIKLKAEENCYIVKKDPTQVDLFFQILNSFFVIESIPIQGSGEMRGDVNFEFELYLPQKDLTNISTLSFYTLLPKANKYEVQLGDRFEWIESFEDLENGVDNRVGFEIDMLQLDQPNQINAVSIYLDDIFHCSINLIREYSMDAVMNTVDEEALFLVNEIITTKEYELLALTYSAFLELKNHPPNATVLNSYEPIAINESLIDSMLTYYACD